jgi:lipopolysaccharide/colanic/teichoic acid biosynthesis glycosyltransferase
MSFVGPRPLLPEYLNFYTSEESRRHLVRPGLTGWAQINGRNNSSWEKRFEFDLWYVNNFSLFLDIYILINTFWKVTFQRDINKSKVYTMPKFHRDINEKKF